MVERELPKPVGVPNEGDQGVGESTPDEGSLLFLSTVLPSVPHVLFTFVHKDEAED